MDAPSVHDVALGRLTRVLGVERGNRLARQILDELGLSELRTPEDLMRFGTALEVLGGYEAAIGAMLRLHARICKS